MNGQCPACGSELLEGAQFCHQCGASVWSTEAEAVDRPENRAGFNRGQGIPGDRGPAASGGERSMADEVTSWATRSSGNRRGAADRETEIWQGRYSPRAMLGYAVAAVLLTIVAFGGALAAGLSGYQLGLVVLAILALWAGLYLLLLYRQYSVHYLLTSQRFVHESGILRRVTDRVEVIDIDDVTFEQGLFERLLGVGTIHLVSSDRTHPELHLPGIADVKRVASWIDDARRDERRKRGLHIESI